MKSIGLLLIACAILCAADLRLGIVGTDTSHVTAFTKFFNDEKSPDRVPGAHVVAAFKSSSPDIPESAGRVEKYAEELRTKWGVEFVPDIPTLCGKVDGVLLESIDGRVHLEQVKPVIAAHKPVFIDKPLAATLEDAREIARLAKQAGVPWFSTSSLRYGEVVASVKSPDAIGVETWGPGPLEEHHHLDLAWYAIHPIEILYTLMGPGCVEVTRMATTQTPGADVVVGRWRDGRIGTLRALRPYGDYGAVVFTPKEVKQSPPKVKNDYRPMLVEIVKFFQTGKPPVPNEETLEIYAFMDAAQRSKEAGGGVERLR